MSEIIQIEETKERTFASSFIRSYTVPVEVTVTDKNVTVVALDSVPHVQYIDMDPHSLTYGRNLMVNLQKPCDMGFASYRKFTEEPA